MRNKALAAIFLIVILSFPAAGEGNEEFANDIKLYSMEFREADVRDIIRFIGQETGLNIIINDDITGTLSLSFKDVTLMDALGSILKTHQLSFIKEGNIIRIIKGDTDGNELDTATEMVRLNYSDAGETSKVATPILGKKGSISIDKRTNTLIIKDTQDNINKIKNIIYELDTETPQVLIEARIIEVSTDFVKELGIQWGGGIDRSTSSWNTTATGGISRGSSGSPGNPLTGGVGFSGNNLMVNLPATVGSGAGGSIGFSFGNIKDTLNLDIQLSAMEDTGNGSILSHPRILTLDNKEARISSGTEIIIPTATLAVGGASGGGLSGSSATTGVTTVDAKLELVVLPHVTSNENIMLHVRVNKKDPDFNRSVDNIPPLTTKTAETDLLVRNGETIVIGGILTKNESFTESGVPFFSKLPILGYLFKKEVKREGQSELLIFLTPNILKQNDSLKN